MVELLRFILDNVLGPVFDHDLAMVRGATNEAEIQDDNDDDDDDDDNGDEYKDGRGVSRVSSSCEGGRGKSGRGKKNQTNSPVRHNHAGDAILDPTGPKLIEGFRDWLLFYQLIGHINWPRAPLYVALTFRVVVFLITNYIMLTHFIFKIIQTRVLDLSFSNPIFVLISLLTLIVGFLNNLAIFYTGTFNLCPMYKILETPRLCFVNAHTQRALGSTTLKYMLVFFMYQTLLLNLLVNETFAHFIYNFNLFHFLLQYYSVMVYSYSYVGLANLDFYVRSCFGAWLLALATNLECRRARLERMQQLEWAQQSEPARRAHSPSATPTGPAPAPEPTRARSIMSKFCHSYLFISLDEIQKSLNTMDDHLEVTRAIQTFSLVLIDLLAFLASGGLFLIAYNALAKANDVYHGSVFILLAFNFAFLVMLTYLGDSFINYALGKLVQTVEDEYFLQETNPNERRQLGDEISSISVAGGGSTTTTEHHENHDDQLSVSSAGYVTTTKDWLRPPVAPVSSEQQVVAPVPAAAAAAASVTRKALEHEEAPRAAGRLNRDQEEVDRGFMSIKRSDVLFCRELLEQFENHLATPWSNLTFKAHLHIMGHFATLVAAQIIFDSH